MLSRNHENLVEQLKHKCGIILFRMLYHNIIAVLTFPATCISKSCIKIEINLYFYFHTFSLKV